jgi:hypothetical protein
MTWFDDNERKAYPLTGDDDGAIPQDVLADLLIHAPNALGTSVAVTSVVVTSLVVSVVISISGTPAAYATIENSPDLAQTEVPLSAIVSGVSGFVVFGSGVQRQRLNVTGTYAVQDSCVVQFEASPTTPTLMVQGRELFGQVVLEAGADIEITAENVVIDGLGTKRAAVFRLAAGVRGEPVAAAYRSAEATLLTPPVRLINGCPPPLSLAVVTIRELPTEAVIGVAADPVNHAIRFVDSGAPCT